MTALHDIQGKPRYARYAQQPHYHQDAHRWNEENGFDWQGWNHYEGVGHQYNPQKQNGYRDVRSTSHIDDQGTTVQKTELTISTAHRDDTVHDQDCDALPNTANTFDSLGGTSQTSSSSISTSATKTSALAASITSQDFTKEYWKVVYKHREYMRLRLETLKLLRQAAEEELAGDEEEVMLQLIEEKKKERASKRSRDDPSHDGDMKNASVIEKRLRSSSTSDSKGPLTPPRSITPTTPPRLSA
jgi:septum formation inhibitor MinC